MKSLLSKNLLRALLLVPLAAVLSSCATGLPAVPPRAGLTQPEAQPFRLAILGDSLSAGVNSEFSRARPTHGWVEIASGLGGGPYPAPLERSLFDLWPDAGLKNFAVSGTTAYQWSFDKRLKPILDFQPQVVVVFIGGNDLLAAIGDGVVTEAEMTAMKGFLAQVVDKLKAGLPKAQLVIVSYYDLFDGLSERLPGPLSRFRSLSDLAKQANAHLADLARTRNCDLVDLGPVFLHHAYGADLGDPLASPVSFVSRPLVAFDIHPNYQGHLAIAQRMLGYFSGLAARLKSQSP